MTRFIEWWRRGSAMIWTSGAVLALSLLMIGGLVGYIAVKGLAFFWPHPIVEWTTPEGKALGMITNREAATTSEPARIQIHQGNRDLFGQDFRWINDPGPSAAMAMPQDAVLVERLEYGPFIGRVQSLRRNGQEIMSHGSVTVIFLSSFP